MDTTRILVTGGTGTLGRHVVPRLRDAGRAVCVLSRRRDEVGDGIVDLHAGFRILPVVLLDGRGESRVDCAFQIELRADADAWWGEFELGHDLSMVGCARRPM